VVKRARIGDGTRGTILVTGGAGYVGSHIVKALALAGFRPLIYDKFTTGSSAITNWGIVERGDMTDHARLRSVITEYKPLAVIHAATSPGMSDPDRPQNAYDSIMLGTLNLLDVMRDTSISLLCLIASSALYGESSALYLTEEASVRPLTAYGASLAAVETMISDFSLVGDLRWVSLRLFSAAGADPDLDMGWRLTDSHRLIPTALDAASDHRSFVPVYGSHFATRDGTALRDYVHVSDIADVTLRSLEGLFSNRAAGPYNIGTGVEYSVFDVIHAVERIVQKKPTIRYEAKRKDEPPMLSADPARAALELLWKPKQSSLDYIVSTEWAYRQALWQTRSEAGLLGMRLTSPEDTMIRNANPSSFVSSGDLREQDHAHKDVLDKLDAFLEEK